MTPFKWVCIIFAILAIFDAIRSYIGQYFGLVICDGVILFILLIAFFMSRQSKRRKP